VFVTHERRLRSAPRPCLYRVDAQQARLVAGAFLDAPREPSDDVVHAAYRDLARQADRWFARLTGDLAPTPIRVVHTRVAEPYATGEELAARVRAEHVLELCPARFDRDRPHPLLEVSPGGTYDRFRAVHDIVSHARFGFGFDRDGEYSAWLAEDAIYRGLARWALATELHAEHSVRWTTGTVAEHKAALLPPWVLRASRRPPIGRSPVSGDPRATARPGR
jgi:hypothetical protein